MFYQSFKHKISFMLESLVKPAYPNSASPLMWVTPFKVHVPFGLLCLVSNKAFKRSGDKGIRTLDPLLARQVLSQLSYTPAWAYYFYHFSCFLSSVFSFFILAATYSPIPSPV